jgi:hypothetical protein
MIEVLPITHDQGWSQTTHSFKYLQPAVLDGFMLKASRKLKMTNKNVTTKNKVYNINTT